MERKDFGRYNRFRPRLTIGVQNLNRSAWSTQRSPCRRAHRSHQSHTGRPRHRVEAVPRTELPLYVQELPLKSRLADQEVARQLRLCRALDKEPQIVEPLHRSSRDRDETRCSAAAASRAIFPRATVRTAAKRSAGEDDFRSRPPPPAASTLPDAGKDRCWARRRRPVAGKSFDRRRITETPPSSGSFASTIATSGRDVASFSSNSSPEVATSTTDRSGVVVERARPVRGRTLGSGLRRRSLDGRLRTSMSSGAFVVL